MVASDLVLLKHDTALIIWMRSMEVFTVIVFFFTILIIHSHSNQSVGMYKYCLYQIVTWPLLSHVVLLFGPVIVLPITGVYQYIDCIEKPAIIHGILSAWVLICCFDIQSITDGFTFRLRILLLTYYPELANKYFWIATVLLLKVTAAALCGCFIAPIGQYLRRENMRLKLIENYPNVVATFDEYKSFVVYDIERLTGFKEAIVIMSVFMGILCTYGVAIVLSISILLHVHRESMSTSTRRLHARFIAQLNVQALVPFVVLICPLIAILTLTLMQFQFASNFPGYAITIFLLMHSPLTSIMMIALYDPFRRGAIEFFTKKIICRSSASNRIHASVSHVRWKKDRIVDKASSLSNSSVAAV